MDPRGCDCSYCTGEGPQPGDRPPLEIGSIYVPCEVCGGTGETIVGVSPRYAYDEPSDYAVLCSACDGYGMECVDAAPVTTEDLDQPF